MSTGSITPFVDDDEEDGSGLYSVGSNDSDASSSNGGKLGPDGDGKASNNGSAMPQYSSRQSGATNPENNAPANTGGKSSGADPLAGSLYEAPPTAPTYQAPDRSRYQSDRAKMEQDEAQIDRNAPGVKPTAMDYIRGGLVGGLEGALGRDNGQGKAIVNHRYADAVADQQARVAQDKDVVAGDRQDLTDYGTDQEEGRKYYETGLQGYTADQNAKNQQWDREHTLSRDTVGDQHWGAEDTERRNRDLYTQMHDNAALNETQRHDRASEGNESQRTGFEGRRVSLEEKKLQDEESDTANGLPPRGSAADQRIRAQNVAKYEQQRKDQFSRINNGDSKASDEYHQKGFQQSLKELQTSQQNPDTEEAWKPGEREAAIAQLKQRHLDDLNSAETDYVDNMHGMGYRNIQPIQFDEWGAAKTDSMGRPLPGRGGAPAPAQQQQPQQPNQGQQPPARQAVRTPSGKTVNVGDIVSVGGRQIRITGVNPKTGKPTGVPVGQ